MTDPYCSGTGLDYDQTHWVPKQQQGQLPTFYYHDHFVEVIDFVGLHYAHALGKEHAQFIASFRDLSEMAQCLYVRLINRKGRLFAQKKLRYPELGELAPIIAELRETGWIAAADAAHFDDLLDFLTRAEIYRALLPLMAGVSRSLKKADLLQLVKQHVLPDALLGQLDTRHILVQRRADTVRYLLFLYFGEIRDSLSRFTMRDLGLVHTQSSEDTYEPRFSDRDEALEHYFFAERLQRSKKASDQTIATLLAEAVTWPDANFASSAVLRDELALRLGRAAEKRGDKDQALELFARGESLPCTERIARLLLATGAREDAQRFLEDRMQHPRSDDEWHFACDLYERKFKKKRTSALTDVLRAASSIDIDESRIGAPERAVIEYFEDREITAYRTENQLWRTFFGLLFWELLFVNKDAKTHSPFEFLPASVANGSFWDGQQDAIVERLAILNDPASAKRQLLKTSTRFYGTPNGVFRWRQKMNDAIFALIDHASPAALRSVLENFCKDYANVRYGYPDLMIVDENGIRFVEVKTSGDQLRRNQLVRLAQLKQAGFRADVLRVRWVLDPDQTYVVVDVETTGGRGQHHRVTEIGAVKVRGSEIVDKFQTLLNPERNIPQNITRLTGISPAMVADAPYFSDIADEFEAFLDDAIFVAHNVEFDYRFIGAEFARIGRSFRMPKLCTCSSMRKLYPGHRSYSLAELCRNYGIGLQQHHRALCDAEAAAELLFLINDRRLEAQ